MVVIYSYLECCSQKGLGWDMRCTVHNRICNLWTTKEEAERSDYTACYI